LPTSSTSSKHHPTATGAAEQDGIVQNSSNSSADLTAVAGRVLQHGNGIARFVLRLCVVALLVLLSDSAHTAETANTPAFQAYVL
jgi:hypothetical protein